jgi:hypothetical protein
MERQVCVHLLPLPNISKFWAVLPLFLFVPQILKATEYVGKILFDASPVLCDDHEIICCICRTSDAKMIANFRMQAELSAIESTEDGKNIVLGTVDGCLSVLAIADPAKPEMKEYLAALPSRDEEVCDIHSLFTVMTAASKSSVIKSNSQYIG